MGLVIDVTDFTEKPYKFPNQVETKELDTLITEHEKDLLISLIGYEQYLLLYAAVNSSGDLADPWADFVNGADYTYNGKTYEYRGLVDLLKPAIYANLIDVNAYKFTATGVVRKGSTNPNPQLSQADDNEAEKAIAWNKYVHKVGHNYTQEHSLYGFLIANTADYGDWEEDFKLPLLINRFNL